MKRVTMTPSNPLAASSASGPRILRWSQSPGWRATGILTLLLALLFTGASFLLSVELAYPEILIDNPSFAVPLVAHAPGAGLAGFLGLLLCGALLVVLSLSLAPHLEEKRRSRVLAAGYASGMLRMVGALLGLVLVPLWSSVQANAAHIAALITLVLAELAAPLLLALWTVALAWQFRAYRVLGWVGAIGLLLAFARSLVWAINALLPIESGFYGVAGILNILALLGESFWLFWLFLLGFRLMNRGAAGVETKLEVCPGMFHAFSAGAGFIPESRLAAKHIVKFIRQHLKA